MHWKSFAGGAFTVYLVTAIMAGASLGRMPAMNALGKVYVGLTWPGAMFCVASRLDCDVLPPQRVAKHFFDF